MRGKSIDTEFVSAFIQECAADSKTSPEDICNEALFRIDEIDKHLKLRLKLVDVLSFFNYKKKNNIQNINQISFDPINKDISNEIFSILNKEKSISNENIIKCFSTYNEGYKKDLIFTLKQLLEAKIISRDSSGNLIFGQNYNSFYESKINKT